MPPRAAEPERMPSAGEGGVRSWLRVGLPWAAILAVALIVLLPKLGQFGFWDPWEPKYAQSAREMLERDSFFVPYYDGEVRLTKPILVYWGVLAGSALFGLNEFGARIGGVCLAIASMLATYYTISILRGRRAGLLAALVLGTLPLFFLLARTATPDVYLFTSLGSSLLFFCLAAFGPARRRDLHFAVSYACFALAVLAKGPVIAGVVYFGPLAIYALARADLERLWRPDLRSRAMSLALLGLPAAAATVFFALALYLLGTSPEWWGYSASSRQFAFGLRERLWDVIQPLHLAEAALVLFALAGGWIAFRCIRRGSGNRRWLLALFPVGVALVAIASLAAAPLSIRAIVAAALGVLTCPAVLLDRILWVSSHPAIRDAAALHRNRLLRQALSFLGVFAAVAGPWHLAIFFKERQGYFTDFILKHNVGRVGDVINSTGNADFFLGPLVFGLFPWSCLLPLALLASVQWGRREALRRQAVEVYLSLSAVVIFAAFSASVTKFSYYIAPILLPLAALIGIALDRLLDPRYRRTARLAWIAALLLYLPVLVDLFFDPENLKYIVGAFTVKRAVPASVIVGPFFVKLLVVWAVLLALLALVARSRVLVGGLVACAVLFGSSLASDFIPRLSPHKTMKLLAEGWERNRAPDEPICFHGSSKHGAIFYTARAISFLDDEEEFMRFMRPEQPAFCIVERKLLKDLVVAYRARYPAHRLALVEESHFDFVLVANHPVGDGPPAPGPRR